MTVVPRSLAAIALFAQLALPGRAVAAEEAGAPAPADPAFDAFAERGPVVYQVGVGDTIAVRVFGQESFKDGYMVDDDGHVDLPWVGPIEVAGMSVGQITRLITTALADGYLRDPQVTVQVDKHLSQPVQVLGAVKKADTYYLQGPTRILDLLAMVGGVEADKSSSEIHITRTVDDGSVTKVVDMELLMNTGNGNLRLQAGDVVNVLEGKVFYVGGEVGKPGEIPWRGGLTVTRALALAGGSKNTANLRRATLTRADGTKTRINIRRIMKGKDEDVVLKAGDQLFVGESAL
jgi:polysaccharide export outer membrane protein